MKNNRGFTLVELLAVIVILAILITIAVTSTLGISNRLKENMYCKKIDSIEVSAKLYGEDYKENFEDLYEGKYSSKTIQVKDLIQKGYLKKEDNNGIIDPRNNSNMENLELIVYEKYNRIYVHFTSAEINDVCKK